MHERLIESNLENFVDDRVKEIVSDVFQSLTTKSSDQTETNSNRIIFRYRSASNHYGERKFPFYHATPRCSLPLTKDDLIYHHSRRLPRSNFVSTSRRSSSRSSGSNDIRYSFSLHHSGLKEHQSDRLMIKFFANQLIETSINEAISNVCTMINKENSSNVVQSFANRFSQTIVERAIERVFEMTIAQLSEQMTDDLIHDAFAIVAEQQIAARTIHCEAPINDIPSLVKSMAQTIVISSIDQLKQSVECNDFFL